MSHNPSIDIKYSIQSHNVYFPFTVLGSAENKISQDDGLQRNSVLCR